MKHAGAPYSGTPALRLFITAAEQVGEATGDIIHLSLLGGNIAVAVYIEGRKEISVTCIVLYLLH